jgi:hypothetical protein
VRSNDTASVLEALIIMKRNSEMRARPLIVPESLLLMFNFRFAYR